MKIGHFFKSQSMHLKHGLIALVMTSSALFASAPAQAAGELENVTLTVLVSPLGAPQAFLKDSITHPQGIDIDVIYEMQRRLGFKLKEDRIYAQEREDAFRRIRAGQADIFIGGISKTAERQKIYDFTPVYYASCLGLLYNPKRHPNVKGVEDMKGMRIGISEGSTSASYVQRMGGTPVGYRNTIMAYFQVYSGDLDGIFFDRPPLAGFVNDMKFEEFAVTPEGPVGREDSQYAMVLTKDSPYTDIISQTLTDIIHDGTMQRILEKWNAGDMSIFNPHNDSVDIE